MYNFSNPVAKIADIQFVRAFSILVGVLLVVYIGVLSFVMTYGVIQIQSAEAVRDTSAHVATLDAEYFDTVAKLSDIKPESLGFEKPSSIAYITNTQTAVSMRTR